MIDGAAASSAAADISRTGDVRGEGDAWQRLRQRAAVDPLSLADIFSIGGEAQTLSGEAGKSQRIAILGSLTTQYISRAVACAAVQEGMKPTIYEAPHGTLVQEILTPDSQLHRFAPDLVLIAPDCRDLVERNLAKENAEAVESALMSHVSFFENLWGVLDRKSYKILQHTLVPLPLRHRGAAERTAPGSLENQILQLNARLAAAGGSRVHWVEMDRFAVETGLRDWYNERLYFSARLQFDLKLLDQYIPWVRSAWRAACARGKKALVLDLDNTLWGGVIGDDGVAGIALGPSKGAVGEAFQAWQLYLKELSDRGVILAVCSKNDPAIAAGAFEHPQSVLKRQDFAAFECSWGDKAHGLRKIAAALNIDLSAIVFADDNPAEIELIRQNLPEVEAVHLGNDPAAFVRRLEAGQWFYLPKYTHDDLARGATYQIRHQAEQERQSATSMDDYLRGLRMTGDLHRATPADLARLAQLEMKTNQFNLTTRRHSEDALKAFRAQDDHFVLAFGLDDKFGSHGLVSSLVAIPEDDTLSIDSWVMSCRIFGRTAEQFIMRGLVQLACGRGFRRLAGAYDPTDKNGIVADLYPRLGFTQLAEGRWARDLSIPPDDLHSFVESRPPEEERP